MSRNPAETPLMRQYLDIKDKHPDAVLFFRLGDFYEMFFEDAVLGARLLDLTLTTRDKGKDDAVPMCGVPHHAARGYIAKLTELGHKVVLCEQVEDPKLAKGLVKREVVRIVTPGIVLDDEVLEPKLPRYVVALVPASRAPAKPAKARITKKPAFAVGTRPGDRPVVEAPPAIDTCGLAYLDATTGELAATELAMSAVVDELVRIAPREVICAPELLAESSRLAPIRARYRCAWNAGVIPDDVGEELAALDVDPELAERPLAGRAAAAVVAYARSTQPTGALPITRLALYAPGDSVVLDEAAIANLELVETLIGRKRQGSLLDVVDDTVTAPGGRLLRRWLLYPLVDVERIRRRQDAVAWLVERPALTDAIRKTLGKIADLERLAGKCTLGVATPRDLGRLRDALLQLPELIELVRSGHDAFSRLNWSGDPMLLDRPADLPALLDLRACADPALPKLARRLSEALVDEVPALLKDGGVIRAGFDATIDDCRRLADGGKDEILAIEEREQKATQIASLKVRYNRVFGYYLEVTKSHLAKVPAHYVRKQTIATGERYVTPELAELERKVLGAEDTLAAREAELFRIEVQRVAQLARQVSAAGAALAVLDACGSLAQVAAQRGYCRPTVDDGLALDLVDGRHPVIEALLPEGTFVPNDCRLDAGPESTEQLVLITGPNMAGKSTYMRQVAQIVLLAQIGSFVPAKAATIGLCDRVFTRVGAADNLSRGDSTFMVEMRETATILAKATRRSLVVLDEVGRGTSTFDGVSIAWAVGEYLHDVLGARTLFATHYHELVALADTRRRVKNVSVAVREHKGEIVFLRRVVPGGASKSYGIDVARLAGLPASVIARSREIMSRLEGGSQLAASPQLSLLAPAPPSPALARLATVDLDRTTPLQALQILDELKALLS
ncbi:MAG TPA: DNA mismatch repair protein MutS [Kofleriaceae bacterium]|nr:DNA mismatch repair protein MutS [Kofleriaceae bacterium]